MAESSCICPTSGSKGGSEVDAVLSETEMIIAGVEPTPAAAGVPVRPPVDALKAAQPGCCAIVNASVSPSASLAVGVNAYGSSCITNVGGEPLITGGVFVGDGGDVFVLEADSPPPLQAQSVSAPEEHAIVSHCTCGRDLGI